VILDDSEATCSYQRVVGEREPVLNHGQTCRQGGCRRPLRAPVTTTSIGSRVVCDRDLVGAHQVWLSIRAVIGLTGLTMPMFEVGFTPGNRTVTRRDSGRSGTKATISAQWKTPTGYDHRERVADSYPGQDLDRAADGIDRAHNSP